MGMLTMWRDTKSAVVVGALLVFGLLAAFVPVNFKGGDTGLRSDFFLRLNGYVFDESVNTVSVRGVSSLPEGALLVVEVGDVPTGGIFSTQGWLNQTVSVDKQGNFEVTVPLGGFENREVLAARVAFDPLWSPNERWKNLLTEDNVSSSSALFKTGDPKGEYTEGDVKGSGGAEKGGLRIQLYDDELIFKRQLFSWGL